MNILITFNDAYVIPTKVMLKSLIMNNDSSEFDIFVVYESLSAHSIELIHEIESPSIRLQFLQISYDKLGTCPVTGGWSRDTYVRLFVQNYLNDDLDRILYLDGDIIVNKSIQDFYDQEFEGNYYIAVEDQVQGRSEERHRKLNMPLDSPYVCAGVLLINLREIKKCVDDNSVLEFINQNKDKLDYLDQDVLNGLFYQHIKVVENFQYNFFPFRVKWNNIREWHRDVKIIHYGGDNKPWQRGYRYSGYQLWWRYALTLGDEYRRLYRRNYLSCLISRLEHGVALFMQDKMPSVFMVAARVYMKKKEAAQT